ncbi:hypothetical protein Br6_04835 [Rhodococcus sp. Br-6]|nr:hypothetical protein Br6_04835 [Rhodococcus sp. Br-6]
MTDTLALTDTPADDLTMVDATVVVHLNTSCDSAGRPKGFLDGYQPGDFLERALEYRLPVLPTVAGINAALEQVYFDLNVGDDPAFAPVPKEAVLQYRAAGNRSLSVGDVVEILDRRYAVARSGFCPL